MGPGAALTLDQLLCAADSFIPVPFPSGTDAVGSGLTWAVFSCTLALSTANSTHFTPPVQG